jgi:RNA polymerase sigma-70 factor (ECF subfamily)
MGPLLMEKTAREPLPDDLIQAARDGDQKALSLLIERSQPQLYRFCLYLTGDPRLSEDLCQDTYVKVIERLKSLREPGDFRGWLYRTAKNLYIDQWRRAKKREVISLDPVQECHGAPAEPMPDLVLQIRSALACLDLESQVLLLLIDQQGYSYREASEILGISQAAVTSRIHRVRRTFWKAYEKP